MKKQEKQMMWKRKKQEPVEAEEDDEPIVININIESETVGETTEAKKKPCSEKRGHSIEIKDIKIEGEEEDIESFRQICRSLFHEDDILFAPTPDDNG
ncbi:MAG: hypothetical protein LUB83_02740 [Prevotellaceae bacterium]|nr:hypothetical protein [Prevotellaceae bacterium]